MGLAWHGVGLAWHGGLPQVQAEVDELPAPSTYSSQGESAEELKRLKEEERALETEVHPPAPLCIIASTLLGLALCAHLTITLVLFQVVQGMEWLHAFMLFWNGQTVLANKSVASRRRSSNYWMPTHLPFLQRMTCEGQGAWSCSLNLNLNPTISVNVQRAACEGQRMELQQAIGGQERELRARQSASPAP